MLKILLPLITGICLQSSVHAHGRLILFLFVSSLLLLIPVFFLADKYRYSWLFGVLFTITMIITGMGLIRQEEYRIDAHRLPEGKYAFTARVIKMPVNKKKGFNVTLAVESVHTGGQWVPSRSRVLGYFEADSTAPFPEAGDAVMIQSVVRHVKPPMNPGEFDYRRHLRHNGISAQTYVKKGSWHLISRAERFNLNRSAGRIRDRLLNIYRKYGMGGDIYDVLAALTLGYRDELSDERQSSFADAGIIHILAVSGMHVAIVYMFFYYALSFLNAIPGGRIIRSFLLVILVWFFALLTGLSPSVQRAAAMFTIIAMGNMLNRNSGIYNALAVSALLLILVNPPVIFQPGFQLSYVAVAGIVFFHPLISGWWNPGNPIVRQAWSLASVTISAQLATFPISIYYFHQFPVYFLAANMVAIPLATIIIYLGMTAFIVAFWPWLQSMIVWLLNKATLSFCACASFIEALPGSVVRYISIPNAGVFILYLLICSITGFLIGKKNKYLIAGLLSVLILSLNGLYSMYHLKEREAVTVYCVPGRTNICLSRGGRAWMYTDAGSREEWERAWYFIENDWIRRGLRRRNASFMRMPSGFESSASMNYVVAGGPEVYKGLVSFFSYTIFLLNFPDLRDFQTEVPLEMDILVITGRAGFDRGLLDMLKPGQIVLDSSVTGTQSMRWISEADRRGIPCHNVNTSGCYQLIINR